MVGEVGCPVCRRAFAASAVLSRFCLRLVRAAIAEIGDEESGRVVDQRLHLVAVNIRQIRAGDFARCVAAVPVVRLAGHGMNPVHHRLLAVA